MTLTLKQKLLKKINEIRLIATINAPLATEKEIEAVRHKLYVLCAIFHAL